MENGTLTALMVAAACLPAAITLPVIAERFGSPVELMTTWQLSNDLDAVARASARYRAEHPRLLGRGSADALQQLKDAGYLDTIPDNRVSDDYGTGYQLRVRYVEGADAVSTDPDLVVVGLGFEQRLCEVAQANLGEGAQLADLALVGGRLVVPSGRGCGRLVTLVAGQPVSRGFFVWAQF